MQQQINLYLPEFKVKKDLLTPLLMGQILGGLLAVCVLVSAWDLFTRWRLNSELAELQEVLVEETQRTDQLDEQLALRSQNTALTNRLEQAEARLDASRQIRRFLSDTTLGNVEGFSEYFKDLSRAAIDGLSLSEFSFANGGAEVLLAGQVVDSAMVPRYVDNIEAGQSPLRDRHLSLSITRFEIEDQFFSFVLSSSNE
ncbi:MAG: hypothetical protein GKR91_09715 [Pseudomonadales bacterium]|nr:hypothetical protein [Pseudomonadales bacterium]